MLPRTIGTDRLRLRVPRLDDARAAFDTWCCDPEVTRYLTWTPHASVEDTRAFLARAIESWDRGTGHLPWIIEKKEGAPIGTIGVTLEGSPEPRRATFGYCLGVAFWGRGLATEAARAVVTATLAIPSVRRVWTVCDVENAASARVLEKCGMEHEGVLRRWAMHPNRSPEPRDCRCYAAVR